MKRRTLLQSLPVAALLPSASGISAAAKSFELGGQPNSPQRSFPVYELRVYHAAEGKLDALLARFRDHTMKLFEKHGIKNVAYWLPTDDPLKGNTLIYMLVHPSRDAATANWKAFQDDPDWQAVKSQSEANGKLVDKVESTFLSLTDFSPAPR
jgi:hypothetical protein